MMRKPESAVRDNYVCLETSVYIKQCLKRSKQKLNRVHNRHGAKEILTLFIIYCPHGC